MPIPIVSSTFLGVRRRCIIRMGCIWKKDTHAVLCHLCVYTLGGLRYDKPTHGICLGSPIWGMRIRVWLWLFWLPARVRDMLLLHWFHCHVTLWCIYLLLLTPMLIYGNHTFDLPTLHSIQANYSHRGLRNFSQGIRCNSVNFPRKHYHKIGDFITKPLSREERA